MTETADIQKIWNFDLGALIRKEELNGRHYIVVPMVMILEGVHVGSQGPVYYSLEELAKTPKQWNMKPIVVEHPFRGDTATDLEVYKKQAVGMIMNTHFVDGKLKAEAWIDEELAQEKCPTLLDHIEHRLPMEISTGLFSEMLMESGTWHGEEYKAKIVNIRADHLAILPSKQGACSLSDGAGLLINQSFADNDKTEAKEGDVLNVISTVINQIYPPGVDVVVDYDLDADDKDKDKAEKGSEEKAATKSEDGEEKAESKEPIENAIQPEIFVTADGNKITYEAANNGTLKIEKPDFGSGSEKEEKEEQETEVEVVPIQDNPVEVKVTDKIGKKEFVKLFENLALAAEYLQNVRNKTKDNFTAVSNFHISEDTPGLSGRNRLSPNPSQKRGRFYKTFRGDAPITVDAKEQNLEIESRLDSIKMLQAALFDLKEQLVLDPDTDKEVIVSVPEAEEYLEMLKSGANPDDLTDEQIEQLDKAIKLIKMWEYAIANDSKELVRYLLQKGDRGQGYDIDKRRKSFSRVYDKAKKTEELETEYDVSLKAVIDSVSTLSKAITLVSEEEKPKYEQMLSDVISAYQLDSVWPSLRAYIK